MNGMLADHFPLMGLRLTTPRLELRLPTDDELAALADVAMRGIHDPEMMPFLAPWTDRPPVEVGLSVVRYHWLNLGQWTPQRWELDLVVFFEGEPVGKQTMHGRDSAVTGQVGTGSWLGREFHGKGIGTEMRAAVLHLIFEGLGAEEAVSAAFDYNAPSIGVSKKLGYLPDGIERRVVRGQRATDTRMRLTRENWERHRTVPVEIHNLEPCLPLLGY
jgi:RimJ/RimL family protein N-acetyltransferase